MKSPNLLFLFTDEQRTDTMAAYGNEKIETPNLNRLSDKSTVFQNPYCCQPVCTPSRGSIITGVYPHTHKCITNNSLLPDEIPGFPELCEKTDHHFAYMGKWHLGDEIFAQKGFEEWIATEDSYHCFYRPHRSQEERSPFHKFLLEKGLEPDPNHLPAEIGYRFFRKQIARLPEEVSRPSFLADQACDFLEQNKNRPWSLHVSFLEPHMPFYGPRDDQYVRSQVDVPANLNHSLDSSYPLKARLDAAKNAVKGYEIDPKLATESQWRELIARYWGLCSLIDTHVGRILNKLEETGQMDNTIIVYTSDHGDMMGSHNLLGKGYMMEECTKVPLMIKLPGQHQKKQVSSPVSQIDLVPTLLDLMGNPIPDHLHGHSLRDVLEGKQNEINRDVFSEWNVDNNFIDEIPEYAESFNVTLEEINASLGDNIRSVVTQDGWKFNWSQCGEHQLFNLNSDPYETQNLMDTSIAREVVPGLVEKISRWKESTNDEMPLAKPEV